MNLEELFKHEGDGVFASADRDGHVNTAVYATPMMLDDDNLVWGMTDGRTYRNVIANPYASYLYMAEGLGFVGCRLVLELVRVEDDGPMLAQIKERTARIVSPGAADLVKHAVHFRITEMRALI